MSGRNAVYFLLASIMLILMATLASREVVPGWIAITVCCMLLIGAFVLSLWTPEEDEIDKLKTKIEKLEEQLKEKK